MSLRLSIAMAILMGLVVAVPAATTITVIQRGLALNMASVSLGKGDRLSFTNDDDVIHNIHIFGPGDDDSVDLGLQKPGKLLSYKFDKSGAYRVRCNIHPSVKMAVTVK
ncbi:cupredoxin domain-containing protein [Bradyrhizobium genosp. A]|uniref:cupredoxin domain-containing protein n=1 Tax=Bradyrhizobium genosp. A TaxID=83626 RepID=UPI003CE6C1B0